MAIAMMLLFIGITYERDGVVDICNFFVSLRVFLQGQED